MSTKSVQLQQAIVGYGEDRAVIPLPTAKADEFIEQGLALEVVELDASEADKLIKSGQAEEVPPGDQSGEGEGDDDPKPKTARTRR